MIAVNTFNSTLIPNWTETMLLFAQIVVTSIVVWLKTV